MFFGGFRKRFDFCNFGEIAKRKGPQAMTQVPGFVIGSWKISSSRRFLR